jgi:AcrR family transcriptional regulator
VSSPKSAEAKRGYQSDLRAAQTRLTRRAVVDAAAELFVRHGYSATTIDAVAEAAGVSRKTVFNAVGGKVALLKLAYDWALTGDDEPVPLPERAAVRGALASPDPAEAIRLWVAMMVEIGQRAAPIVQVLEAAADVEPQAAEMVAVGQAGRHAGARTLIDHIADLGGLAAGLTRERATDAFWAQTDPALYRRLVLDRGWSPAEFRDWLTRATQAALLA